MPCILLLPNEGDKGILSFTDLEVKKLLNYSKTLTSLVQDLKKNWIICCHINDSHPLKYTDIFSKLIDLYISGKDYFNLEQKKKIKNLEMDCSRFISDNFCKSTYSNKNRFWDILIVSRNSDFKNLEDFLDIIRLIFNKNILRVLAIIPEYNYNINYKNNSYLRKYLKLFNSKERKFFNIINPHIDAPNSFDQETLGLFYQNCKIFLYTAHLERHPRNAALAWASGQIVVARKNVFTELSQKLINGSGAYIYDDIKEAANKCIKALNSFNDFNDYEEYRYYHLEKKNIDILKKKMKNIFNLKSYNKDRWYLENLPFRLADSYLSESNIDRKSIYYFLKFLKYKSFLLKNVNYDVEKYINKFDLEGDNNFYIRDPINVRLSLLYYKLRDYFYSITSLMVYQYFPNFIINILKKNYNYLKNVK